MRRWKLPGEPGERADRLAEKTGMPVLLCRILAARGLEAGQALDAFLSGEAGLDDPFLLADMDKAVERVRRALEEGEKIAVYGDYDCDGITSTALLTSYLQSVGADVFYYVPSREREGYGLNKNAMDLLAGQKVELIITVDNGISAHQEIEYAASLGMDVVVTDHHTPRDTLPPAVAVVNPHRADCPSRCKELAGVGVAFKLVCALEEADGGELMEYYSDLVALGTIADVVPLTGENRTLVRHGLARLAESERPGFEALLAVSGLAGRALSGESVAFGLAPRINAAGRMDCADNALELLLTDDPGYAMEMAELLDEQNNQRKKIEEDMLGEIEEILRQKPHILRERLLLISGNGWHHGVVGIVAAKLVERYGKPCILFSIDDEGIARGSGRSIEGFSLINAISACSEGLIQYGGHTLAAGLSLSADHLEEFERSMLDYAFREYPEMPVPVIRVDGVAGPAEMTFESIRALGGLEPFGAGNEAPLFLLPGLRVEALYPTNDKKHLRIRLSTGKGSFTAVYFRMCESSFPYRPGDVVDVVAALSTGEYNGKPQLSVRIKDLRLTGVDQERMLTGHARYGCHLRREYRPGYCEKNQVLPGREDLAKVYKFLRRQGGYPFGAEALYIRLADGGLDYCRLLVALDVLEEMGLLGRDENGALSLVEGAARVDLQQSQILQALTVL